MRPCFTGSIANFSAVVNSSKAEMQEMELRGNFAGGGGGAVFWSHSDRGGERVQCRACTMAGNNASYGAEYATEFVAWDMMPTALTVSALNRTKAGSALQRLTNKEYISDLGRVMQVEAR